MNNNILMETIERPQPPQQQQPQPQPQPQHQQQINIADVEIIDENTALNVMVSFIHLAQKRGAFNLQESAKAWECVKVFMRC
jgi:ABC-type transporter Mla MlaB component